MATLKKKVAIATSPILGKPTTPSYGVPAKKPTDQEVFNFARDLPIFDCFKPRIRLGSHLKALGATRINGEKIRNKGKYIISGDQLSLNYHMNKLNILKNNPNFSWVMLAEYKKAVQEDYNKGIKVNY